MKNETKGIANENACINTFRFNILVTLYQRLYRKIPRSYGSDSIAFFIEAIDGMMAYHRFPSINMEDNPPFRILAHKTRIQNGKFSIKIINKDGWPNRRDFDETKYVSKIVEIDVKIEIIGNIKVMIFD